MAIWLGNVGGLLLQRSGGVLYDRIGTSDVDVGTKRLGFEGDASRSLVTGDQVWIRRVDENGAPSAAMLDCLAASAWADGRRYNDWQGYAHVDAMGSVRLYHAWSDAIAGLRGGAIDLTVPGASMRVSVSVITGGEHCLGQVVSWELSTDREAADITPLGEGFRKQQGTLVSGSGALDCLFDIGGFDCDAGITEPSRYLHQLVLRQQIGATFHGVFILKSDGGRPLDGRTIVDDARSKRLFYACDCVVTSVAAQVEPTELIHSKIDFVTTGPVELLFALPRDYLLKEDNARLLQESGFGVLLESSDL